MATARRRRGERCATPTGTPSSDMAHMDAAGREYFSKWCANWATNKNIVPYNTNDMVALSE